MARKGSSSWNSSSETKPSSQYEINNIRTRPPKIYDNITRRLLWLGVTLSIITFIGLIVRYAVQEFDPSAGAAITLTTSRVNNKDIASLSVSKNFLERMLEFAEESLAIVAAVIPFGFPLCSLLNRRLARYRAGGALKIQDPRVLQAIPKYVVLGDGQACQLPNSGRLRPLVRDTVYQLIKAQFKPKLIVEDSYEEARRLGVRIGLIRRRHHRMAVIKSVDLLKNITDSRGDIKQAKVRYLLSRMKIMSQSTPADKSLLVYLIKYCESQPNENLVYLGYSFTDPEAMRLADSSLTFADCDDEDVRRQAQVLMKSESMSFTDLYLFLMVNLLSSNITQSYALYQISASVCCCLYRFLSITVFQEQLISHSQFGLLMMLQQVFAILALMTKWLSSLARQPLVGSVAEMSHAVTEDSAEADTLAHKMKRRQQDSTSIQFLTEARRSPGPHNDAADDASSASTSGSSLPSASAHKKGGLEPKSGGSTFSSSKEDEEEEDEEEDDDEDAEEAEDEERSSSFLDDGLPNCLSNGREATVMMKQHHTTKSSHHKSSATSSAADSRHIHLSGIDLDEAIISSSIAHPYRHTFRASALIDDVTYRLTKLHITYQLLVMVIIMIFGNAMFQLNMENNRQHQTLAFNSLMMNSIFNLANCFNQIGQFNLRQGLAAHPFFICVLLLAVFVQMLLTELNVFGLENLNPMQWFVCFVFALLSALIAPLSGQQGRQHMMQRRRLQQQKQHQLHPPAQHQSAARPSHLAEAGVGKQLMGQHQQLIGGGGGKHLGATRQRPVMMMQPSPSRGQLMSHNQHTSDSQRRPTLGPTSARKTAKGRPSRKRTQLAGSSSTPQKSAPDVRLSSEQAAI